MTRSQLIEELFWGFEVHAPERIKRCIDQGMSMVEPIDGQQPIDILIRMYTRSDRLATCLQLLLEAGATFDDEALLAVLMDDAETLKNLVDAGDDSIQRRHTFPCAFTPLEEASLLHIAAEYGRLNCAGLLLDHGIDPDTEAGVDEHGFGGQTPIFHTVNSNDNYCRPVMDLLLDHGASVRMQVKGIIWGKGMEWETFIPQVNPVSYAMMGNLPQFHRNERQIADNVLKLMQYRYGEAYPVRNVPNAYLERSKEKS